MKIRDSKASVTLFTLIGLTFMSTFLIVSYANYINKSKIAKEQFNIISNIYSHKDTDADAYDRAYTELRNKNKKTLTKSIYDNSTIELTKTFEEKLINYKIYGNATGMGTWNSDAGKYKIEIEVSNEITGITYNIFLSNQLGSGDYIDFKNQKIVKSNGVQSTISLPDIIAYEDYTKIKVVDYVPSQITIEYVGYEF